MISIKFFDESGSLLSLRSLKFGFHIMAGIAELLNFSAMRAIQVFIWKRSLRKADGLSSRII